ncbi:hypothetical protein B7P43_G14547 [Cryptotermes secundus]|uniref:G-protein coupled receptors family 3 profile domain-containing protein n=1 Tax=Cryptotermes secundus TaxID=105785 RepID=A0A2J7RBE3_9NEOP|nr:metabotropic glutamate receptor isoform X1 [Cryptotermes secundus]XP_033606474.1 metabotropic glutamate receptor isoform X1 [Cryptotermes secundus]PNF38155.1 hypothetical protein B7P43_G14547 [Cryptotermes secundus]
MTWPMDLWLVLLLLLAAHSDGSRRQHRIELSTEFFLVPERSVPPPPGANHSTGVSEGPGVLRHEVWVVPLLALSSLTMLVIAGFEVFVLCKAWRTTPSRRHLFLGQMLLLGLFLCSVLGAVLAATPTPATCAVVRFGTGFAYAVVFSALLVKCVFLISLNGGVYLPAPYQALLLLFAVLIQVAVGAQWLLNSPPRVEMPPHHHRLVVTAEDLTTDPLLLCHTPYTDLLLSLLYVMCLILFVAVLAIKSRGIRDNYREATFIGLAVGCSIPVWLIWVLCGLVVPERHRDACLAFGLVSTATIVFLVMFMPKGRQLAAMGKEGVYVEDREERFSSLSPAGSGYSPSFFHFKPVKYASGPGTAFPAGMLPTHKQTSAVTTLADRVALVAAPPSYTRMYHYYPYCYYPRYPGGFYMKPEDGNVYTTLEPTLSSNPNVFFQRSGVHPGMMY